MKTKICTSPEQSKKLMELGIDVNTADMFYRDNGVDVKLMWEHLPDVQVTTPAWSLVALFDLFPNGSILRKSDKGKYFMFGNMFDNPIDAAFEMVVWLKENNKI